MKLKLKLHELDFHRDIEFSNLDTGTVYFFDSYNLLFIDGEEFENYSGYEKIKIILKELFLVAKHKVLNNDKFFLPLDFSDEYLGGISITYDHNDFFLLNSIYTTDITGHGILFHELLKLEINDKEFLLDGDISNLYYSRENLLEFLNPNIG